MAQSSLADLCSIWWVWFCFQKCHVRIHLILTVCSYTEIPKYRCPRCNTQTCSLPCYKRHQQRASCSGKRDPAAYLKKSQLATASSIDRDYNYLKNVERNIDDAGADARERGAGSQHVAGDLQTRGPRREGAFRRHLAANDITVEYAPKGLSRQKNNQSRVTKNDKIFWTIEWRDASSEQNLRHNAPETSTLTELYRGVRALKRKRKAASETANDAARTAGKRIKASEVEYPSSGAKLPHTTPIQQDETAAQDSQAESDKLGTDTQTSTVPPKKEDEDPEDYFYLLKHSTSPRGKVLIPLDGASTLTKALQGQIVQEYPTIYVLHEPPDTLPSGFVPADKYLSANEAHKGAEGARRDTDASAPAPGSSLAEQTGGGRDLDANAILKMLKRDVRA